MVIKASIASESIAVEAFFTATVISADGVDAVGFVGAVVTAFALVDVLAFRDGQRGFEAVLTLARVRPDRVDALTPRRTMIRAQSAFVDVVARGTVAFKSRIAHALRVVAGEAGGVWVANESVSMRTA